MGWVWGTKSHTVNCGDVKTKILTFCGNCDQTNDQTDLIWT